MMPVCFFLLLLTAADGKSSQTVCSYQDVLNHLNLTKDNPLYSMTRPVRDHRVPTDVKLDIVLYAILDVRELDQTFIPYVWIYLEWNNQHISWNSSDFCDIQSLTVPTDVLWKPDLMIVEMTEKDKAPASPQLTIFHDGQVLLKNDQVLLSTCKMHIYKFPFDIQRCNLSFKSISHSNEELQLDRFFSSEDVNEWSRNLTQYEWLFINMTVTKITFQELGSPYDMIIYTISMKRRSALYIANFILPVMFFLCLDLASFLLADGGGEKLSLKVTVLLAVTVMQLILNDILPSSSNKIPLIAVYCVGIFILMMLSVLETIFVLYLLDKDSASQDSETDKDQSWSEESVDQRDRADPHHSGGEEKWDLCGCVCDETPTELLKVSSSEVAEASQTFEKLSVDLRETVKTLNLFLNSRKEKVGKSGYWARKTQTINKVFLIFYITAVILFLVCLFFEWCGTP